MTTAQKHNSSPGETLVAVCLGGAKRMWKRAMEQKQKGRLKGWGCCGVCGGVVGLWGVGGLGGDGGESGFWRGRGRVFGGRGGSEM